MDTPKLQIDPHAPVRAQASILIHAPVEKVWDIQTDLENWPKWQPNIAHVTLQGPLEQGTQFRWKAQGLTITSTLQAVDRHRQIAWTGISMGMKAVHIWHFEPVDGGTRVTTEESLSGWLTRLLAFMDSRFLDKSMAASLELLKSQAEKST